MRILLAEDDRMIGEAVHAGLKDAAYAVDWVKDGAMVLRAAESENYDLILLDLGLPKKDGLDVLAELRQNAATPVLILTARDDLDSRLRGLDGGADDYLVKPFELAELLARMRAVLRRHSQHSANNELDNGIITLNPATHEARRHDNGETCQLTAREYTILHALMQRPGHILSRAELEDKTYGWGEEVESNAIDYLIHALRKKLGADSIRNVRGVGWCVAREAKTP